MATFNIYNTRGDQVAAIPDGTSVTFSGNISNGIAGLKLVGQNFPAYGATLDENFYYQLENFAGPASPNNPVQGQLWFDTGARVLNVATDVSGGGTANWAPLGGGLIPGGPVSSVQFNKNGNFGGDANLEYDFTLQTLRLAGTANLTTVNSTSVFATNFSGNLTGTVLTGAQPSITQLPNLNNFTTTFGNITTGIITNLNAGTLSLTGTISVGTTFIDGTQVDSSTIRGTTGNFTVVNTGLANCGSVTTNNLEVTDVNNLAIIDPASVAGDMFYSGGPLGGVAIGSPFRWPGAASLVEFQVFVGSVNGFTPTPGVLFTVPTQATSITVYNGAGAGVNVPTGTYISMGALATGATTMHFLWKQS